MDDQNVETGTSSPSTTRKPPPTAEIGHIDLSESSPQLASTSIRIKQPGFCRSDPLEKPATTLHLGGISQDGPDWTLALFQRQGGAGSLFMSRNTRCLPSMTGRDQWKPSRLYLLRGTCMPSKFFNLSLFLGSIDGISIDRRRYPRNTESHSPVRLYGEQRCKQSRSHAMTPDSVRSNQNRS